jgi:nitrogen regulatory protein PII
MKIVHERMGKVNDTLGKNKVVGMTFYYVKGRGHSKYEPACAFSRMVAY